LLCPYQTLTAVALEVQARGVKEHQIQLAEQIAVTAEKLLFDEVLSASKASRICPMLDDALSQPAHGAVQVVKLDVLCPADLEILLPPLCRPIASRIQEAVQHGEEDGPFQGEAASAGGKLPLDRLFDPQLLPQSLEDKGGTDGQGAVRLDGALAVGIDNRSNRGELRQRSSEVVDLT
jgi:hypothetical protein